MTKKLRLKLAVVVSLFFLPIVANAQKALRVVDTNETIMKVRDGVDGNKRFIAASTYDGDILRVGYNGKVEWKRELEHGIMNHDIWCADVTGDNKEEILVASANGSVYCLDSKGRVMWQFNGGDTPMYCVCVFHKDGVPYVLCSNFDTNFYYLNGKGEKIKTIKSSTFSVEKTSAQFDLSPKSNVCTGNFIRPFTKADGSEAVVILGTNSHMNVKGTLYFFDVFGDMPYETVSIPKSDAFGRVIGDFKQMDINNDGVKELFLGASSNTNKSGFAIYDTKNKKFTICANPDRFKEGAGYTVTFGCEVGVGNDKELFTVTSTHTYIMGDDCDIKGADMIKMKYAFNDYWTDRDGNILIASEQSGGSCIYILDTEEKGWKDGYKSLKPEGKYQEVLDNTDRVNKQLINFTKPSYERELRPIYFMDNSKTTELTSKTVSEIEKKYKSPIYLGSSGTRFAQDPKDWHRDTMKNKIAMDKRDRRRSYTKTEEEILDILLPGFNDKGLATWGGHGNDPHYYSPQTLRRIIDHADGRQTIFIYPEIKGVGDDARYITNNLIYPTAEYGKDKNLKIYLRTKNVFWLGTVYNSVWSKVLSGEYSNVFVSSMEETTDKTMELSLAGRVGMWASGCVDDWGTRAITDNASFDRSRQFGAQSMPNHFLRALIYHISYGASYLNNCSKGADYMNIINNLIAKGAIFCPKPEEIVSFSPVHLAIHNPDPLFLEYGANNKWTTFYDKKFEDENPYVIGRLNGSWLGAKVTDWDFSNYAAGVKDRRLNFLAPYNSGLVLFTPVQEGVLADKSAPRGALKDKLHPLYKDIMKEYITDGKKYYSKDGKESYSADTYYKVVKSDIEKSAKLLPINVTGDNVAWVVAQTSPNHLRLTLIDGGYINPDNRVAKVEFNTVKPIKVTDILSGETLKVRNSGTDIDIPCGLFRFIDIEISEAL